MVYHEDWYIFTYSTNDNITLKRSRALTDNWDLAETKVIFKPDPSSGDPWSTDVGPAKTPPETSKFNKSSRLRFPMAMMIILTNLVLALGSRNPSN